MAYTSDQHLGIKLITFFAWGGLIIGFGYLAQVVAAYFGLSKEREAIPFFVAFAIVSGVFFYLLHRYDHILDALAAYWYLKRDLKTPVSWEEAKALSFLFVGDKEGQWYPLAGVRKLPKDQRKQYLFDFAAEIADRRRMDKSLPNPIATHLLHYRLEWHDGPSPEENHGKSEAPLGAKYL